MTPTETPKDAARRILQPLTAQGYVPAGLYLYQDEDGTEIYWKARLDPPARSDKRKEIRPFHLNGGGYKLGEPQWGDRLKPLYLLPELVKADLATPVWYVEGEKCANTLHRRGLLTTTAGGAQSDERTDYSPLKGRAVILWPDNDQPGLEHMQRVDAKLRALGCRVQTLDIAPLGLPKGGDAVDYVYSHANATAADFAALARPFAPAPPAPAADQADTPVGMYLRNVEVVRGSEVTPEPVSWLWNGWLAAGKVHVLGGAPGTGKTTIGVALAATVTSGGRWPDGTRSPVGNVVIWSGEDDPADTLVPRLIQSGADVSRVYFVDNVREGNERRAFDPASDMEPLRRKLAEIGGIRLLIVDPIVSAIAGDSHKNAEVRRGLQPLADLGASMSCVVLGITHFSKGTSGRDPVERLTGSLAFGAVARVVLVAAKHQEEGEDGRNARILLRAKSNIGPDDGGFEYDLQQAELKAHPGITASCVAWGNPVQGAARDLLATADATSQDGEGGTLADAKDFLAGLLADGPMPSKAIRADADGAGFPWSAIRRAQTALHIEARKQGGNFGGGKQQWVWALPGRTEDAEDAQGERLQVSLSKNAEDAQGAQQKKVGTFSSFSKNEHLQQSAGTVEVEV